MPRQSIVLIKAYCPFILINKKASLHDWHFCIFGGDDGIRTHDPLVANEVLSQLSHAPTADYIIAHLYEIATCDAGHDK